MAKRFILLDRDGTIMVDKHYLHDPDEVELLPGAASGLARMRSMGFGLILLSNQSGVGRGYFDHDSVRAVNQRLFDLLRPHGVEFDGSFYCPHAPEEACDCRKPAPGLMKQAVEVLGFDPRECVMIGDKESDILLGRNTGSATILVRTGKGAAHEARCADVADHVVDDLDRAADVIEEFYR
ncbi:D-glycero-alpha-D-manno-heptose-1,7-bisphosphate 7-phosphatase [Pseudodesulfovibrio tunisiensis]|uniref:D-glycero-alpha-D-manno-heptose-1,7-bisphosphate 7-phosphatase n=1 Tax=Pseudodesulfovibrio tunisiensis TaxID=463192 RepID=UPI001FB32F15|nr:HAD family hydrolase [Pseudodesulfovibrio tunisiensis]